MKSNFSLFGAQKQPNIQQPYTNDPAHAITRISNQIDLIEKKEKVIELKMKELVQEAVNFKKANQNKKALQSLRKKKLYEQQLNKIDGMKYMLEQQKATMEQVSLDSEVYQTLDVVTKEIQVKQNGVNAETFAELKDKMDEQQDLRNEICDFFGNQVNNEDLDLNKELDELEDQVDEQEVKKFDQISVPKTQVNSKAIPSQQKS